MTQELPKDLQVGIYYAPHKVKHPHNQVRLLPLPISQGEILLYDPVLDEDKYVSWLPDVPPLKPYSARSFLLQACPHYRCIQKGKDSYGNIVYHDLCLGKLGEDDRIFTVHGRERPEISAIPKCSFLSKKWTSAECPKFDMLNNFPETDLERSLWHEYLNQSKIESDFPMLIPQVWIEPPIGAGFEQRFRVDFALFNVDRNGEWRRYAVEAYSEKWHTDGMKKFVDDAQRERVLNYMGYNMLRFWQIELKQNMYKCIREVMAIANI